MGLNQLLTDPRPRTTRKSLVVGNPYRTTEKFYLPTPAVKNYKSFFKVLTARASRRNFKQISDEKLSDFLWYSAKALTMTQGPDAVFCQHRFVPSAGGIHPIDLLVISIDERTVSLYDPIAHALHKVEVEDNELDSFLQYTNTVLHPESGILIWYAARPEKVSAKYYNEISLIWRDAGALLASMYLIAEALQLNCCALGVLGNQEIQTLTNNSSIMGVGGCIIGARK